MGSAHSQRTRDEHYDQAYYFRDAGRCLCIYDPSVVGKCVQVFTFCFGMLLATPLGALMCGFVGWLTWSREACLLFFGAAVGSTLRRGFSTGMIRTAARRENHLALTGRDGYLFGNWSVVLTGRRVVYANVNAARNRHTHHTDLVSVFHCLHLSVAICLKLVSPSGFALAPRVMCFAHTLHRQRPIDKPIQFNDIAFEGLVIRHESF